MPRRVRFTRITGTMSGVQEDEADLEAPEIFDVNRRRRDFDDVLGRLDYLPGTFDPLSDPLDDPFPEELR